MPATLAEGEASNEDTHEHSYVATIGPGDLGVRADSRIAGDAGAGRRTAAGAGAGAAADPGADPAGAAAGVPARPGDQAGIGRAVHGDGVNIARVRKEPTGLPLVVLDRTYIDQTGASTNRELLQTVPQIQIR